MYSNHRVSSVACLLGLTLLGSTAFTIKANPDALSENAQDPSFSVTVTPDEVTAEAQPANTGGHVLTFTVTNAGTEPDTYEVTCVGVAKATCSGTVPTRLTLNAGQSGTVDASYSVSAVGTGLVSLVAVSVLSDAHDHGSYRVPVTP